MNSGELARLQWLGAVGGAVVGGGGSNNDNDSNSNGDGNISTNSQLKLTFALLCFGRKEAMARAVAVADPKANM